MRPQHAADRQPWLSHLVRSHSSCKPQPSGRSELPHQFASEPALPHPGLAGDDHRMAAPRGYTSGDLLQQLQLAVAPYNRRRTRRRTIGVLDIANTDEVEDADRIAEPSYGYGTEI